MVEAAQRDPQAVRQTFPHAANQRKLPICIPLKGWGACPDHPIR
jgi:hypothetical protein